MKIVKVDNRFAEIVKTALVPYRLNLAPGDRVIIVSDTGTDPMVAQAFMAAAHILDVIPVVTIMTPRPFHHAEPDPMVVAAMSNAELLHLIPSKGLIHSPAVHKLMLAGKRVIASEEITVDMLREGAATADYDFMDRLGARIYEILSEGKRMRITSQEGTDLSCDISGRASWLCAGKVMENPGIDLYGCGFPDGEVGVAPVEASIEGVVVWDTSMHQVGLLTEPIRAVVKHGRATEITGGAEASRLNAYLDRYGDDGSRMICETSVGINDRARVTGLVREDKKLAGSMHIALGMNTDTGGTVASRTHIDGVLRRPTLYIDDVLVVKDGHLAVTVT
jgi:leucyl aminopeptidase (aminopeptidase T)